jgi:uncharacterized protein (TIGR02186 family)
MIRRTTIIVSASLLLLSALALGMRGALSEGVVADLTTHDVAVTVDFTGANVVLFGSVVGITGDEELSPPDVVVEVIGPTRPVQVRQKFNAGGIWVNDEGRHIARAPGYYAVVSNRPLEDIAPAETFRRLGIGFEGLKAEIARTMVSARDGETQEYLDGLVRVMSDRDLYIESPAGARFVSEYLFRAEIELAANVPLGQYDALVYLFRDQEMTGQHLTQLFVEKTGFERFVYSLAHDQPFLYGVLCVIVAAAAGLGAAYLVPRK